MPIFLCNNRCGMYTDGKQGMNPSEGDDDMKNIKTIAELFSNIQAIRADIKRMGAQSFEFTLDCGRVIVSETEVKSI